jgi:hypothetical protein
MEVKRVGNKPTDGAKDSKEKVVLGKDSKEKVVLGKESADLPKRKKCC